MTVEIAKGKRRRAGTGEYENTASMRPQRLLSKRQCSATNYHPDCGGYQTALAPSPLAGSTDYQRQKLMTCAALEPMLVDHYEDGVPLLYGSAMLATPATSPARGVSDSDEWDDDDYDDGGISPASEYYEINTLLGQLHRERMMRQRHLQ
ncbi:hypothetical protein EV175_002239 [Coemansia sp. RSA 1933]|nr:hypothetical protein EV175_002239 [Coemansia sp. RSA 1933]